MKETLLLVHRLPFPPDKGDKIRSYHVFQHLLDNYRVHLGCFIDDPHDEQYIDSIRSQCESAMILRLRPWIARIKSLSGLIAGKPLSVPYYYDAAMAFWVNSTVDKANISSIIVYSSPMAQYVFGTRFAGYRRIMDFVDVDSDKWRQYAIGKQWPMSWVYSREADHLLGFEREVAREFDASIFVTANELELFDSLSPETTETHHAIPNGVATSFFDPEKHFENPFSEMALPLVFTGMMDYWANVDAVTWFAEDVFPQIRSAVSAAEFWIVGASPTPSVLALGSLEGVYVTGRVQDVRPYLAHAKLVVAPLRIARGIQNKVLEALAMGCPVLCTESAAVGLEAYSRAPVSVHDEPRKIAEAATKILNTVPSSSISDQARQYVLDYYSWDRNLEQLERIHAPPVQP